MESIYNILREAIAASKMTTIGGKVQLEAARILGCKPYPIATKVIVSKRLDPESGEIMELYTGTLRALGAGLVLFDYMGKDLLYVEKISANGYKFSSFSRDLFRWNGRLEPASELEPGSDGKGGTLYLDHDRDTYSYYNLSASDHEVLTTWLDYFLENKRSKSSDR